MGFTLRGAVGWRDVCSGGVVMSTANNQALHINPSFKNIEGAIEYAESYLEGAKRVAGKFPLFALKDIDCPCSLCLGKGVLPVRTMFFISQNRKADDCFIFLDCDAPCIECNGTGFRPGGRRAVK